MRASCTVQNGCCTRHPKACTHASGSATTQQSAIPLQHRANLSASLTCAASIAKHWQLGDVPWKLNDKARGVNGQLKVPKRSWARHGVSGSLSRSMQHNCARNAIRSTRPHRNAFPAHFVSLHCLQTCGITWTDRRARDHLRGVAWSGAATAVQSLHPCVQRWTFSCTRRHLAQPSRQLARPVRAARRCLRVQGGGTLTQ